MTDIEKIEKLCNIVGHNDFVTQEKSKHVMITENVRFYINDFGEFSDAKNAYFIFKYKGVEITHSRRFEFSVFFEDISKIQTVSEFSFHSWYDCIEKELIGKIKSKLPHFIKIGDKLYKEVEVEELTPNSRVDF
jgi:hypothetical protein